ncbi:MAG: DUF4143 domain-containing protein [Candidatus Eremiobacteraeota bacterium]|nr:DUF4143 domain-containing protein [Candidatus Eremiobacteraeota bacterium]
MTDYLSGVSLSGTSSPEPLKGALFESYCMQNIIATVESHLPGARFYFWNVQGRHEVDLVIESGGSIFAIEIKSAARWHNRDFSDLKAFLEGTPLCRAAILCYNGDSAMALSDRLWAIPARQLLS